MTKYITIVETSVGKETYILTIESEKAMQVNSSQSTYFFIDNALINEVSTLVGTHNYGPFQEKEYYETLVFPAAKTTYSQKKYEFGGSDE